MQINQTYKNHVAVYTMHRKYYTISDLTMQVSVHKLCSRSVVLNQLLTLIVVTLVTPYRTTIF